MSTNSTLFGWKVFTENDRSKEVHPPPPAPAPRARDLTYLGHGPTLDVVISGDHGGCLMVGAGDGAGQ
jgi:hypothetical protein